MALRGDGDNLAIKKFGVGQPLRRMEDPVLVRGAGAFTDDINLPNQAYAVMVRSALAHGAIRGIDTSAAKSMPGVLMVVTGAELQAAGFGTMKNIIAFPNRDGTPMRKPARPSLAVDRVRFAGDPIACVIAATASQARDAADAVTADIDPLPAVTEAREAAKPGAPLLYEDVPGNLSLDYHFGDTARVDAAFAAAAHVTRLNLINNRLVVAPMEPRAAIGEYDKASGRWTVHLGCQGVMGMRRQLAADILNAPVEKVRVLTRNVGGSFGMKASVYPEYACLLHGAKTLGRPVKWTDDRSGSFVSDHHGRCHDLKAELALDKDGKFLAVRIDGYVNVGAYLTPVTPLMGTLNVAKNTVGVYATPALDVSMKCVFTNTSPVGAYRGAGRPESNYYMERLIDTAAAELGIDRIELRRRNQIKPEQIPYKAPSELTYDSGNFRAVLDRALQAADWSGFDKRKSESRARGKLRGRGIGSFLEVTAPANPENGGIRFEADGTVTILTGTLDYGQGHVTPFAQVLHDMLGIPVDRFRLQQGDSDQLLAGGGTGGSRSAMNSSAALHKAANLVIEKGKQIAAHALEAAAADIEFAGGRFAIAGTDRAIGILELAAKLRQGMNLPAGAPNSLDVNDKIDGVPSTFPNGCHIAEVELDPETGVVEVVKYSTVNDFGTILNPMIVEGQCHGGVVQGIGQALAERVVYSEDGQLLSGSFMDYAMPRAADVPFFSFLSEPTKATTNPLGVKGCGEAGCAGALPSVMNAVVDALGEYGIRHIDMPATPHRVWQAIQDAKRAR
jgi:carbon-monoxide dehydrogenase large subunit